jgi:hypothetical protein
VENLATELDFLVFAGSVRNKQSGTSGTTNLKLPEFYNRVQDEKWNER